MEAGDVLINVTTQRMFTGPAAADLFSIEQLTELPRRANYCAQRLAVIMGFSRRTLERRFRQQMDCTPGEWLAQRRMADAVAMIERQVSLKVVSTSVAYRNPSGFYREFRRRLDCTPGEYQARYLGLGPISSVALIPEKNLSQTDNPCSLPALRVAQEYVRKWAPPA